MMEKEEGNESNDVEEVRVTFGKRSLDYRK
jgi:hypothetical protein